MAITTAQEYWANLYRIQDKNPPSTALLLPSTERIFHVDLNTRTIHGPDFLSLARDHQAEVIYFTCNRFYDYMDLTNTVCLIQYINAAGDSRYYPVPFYDVITPNQNRDLITVDEEGNYIKGTQEELIMFPWCISGDATAAAGSVKYAINFYKLQTELENDEMTEAQLIYSLSTKPTTGQVLYGMGNEGFVEDDYKNFDVDLYKVWRSEINDLTNQFQSGLQWIIAE